MTLETIQSALVPLHLQDAVKQTGVVGAISWTVSVILGFMLNLSDMA